MGRVKASTNHFSWIKHAKIRGITIIHLGGPLPNVGIWGASKPKTCSWFRQSFGEFSWNFPFVVEILGWRM
jgi:hypothetical protein